MCTAQAYWTPFWQVAVGALGLVMFAVAYMEPGSGRPIGNAQRDPHPAQRAAQVHCDTRVRRFCFNCLQPLPDFMDVWCCPCGEA